MEDTARVDTPASPGSERPERRSETRRRRSRSSSSQVRHRRLRALYFALASFWGFVTGTAGVLISLSASGRPLGFGPWVGMVLAASTVIAILGGLIAARAYRGVAARH